MIAGLRVLAVAAASGRVAYVYFSGNRLKDWRVSDAAARSTTEAAAYTQTWINRLQPTVLVTEKVETAIRKGDKTKAIIRAVANTAEHNYLHDISVAREQVYPSKYEEAKALAKRYPELKPWLPEKRRFFENEPRNIVLFEAVALAERVILGPPTLLAAAMG